MKKRFLSLFMALSMALSILPARAAVGDFADVYDAPTATAAEVLRLAGVIDGGDDGLFHPDESLTRAQFCKMVTYAMNAQSELGLYRTVTIFPDVKPSHWAASYVNLAARGKGLIAGYPDGAFHPEDTVTVGQAVTILLRLLGYKDADVGGVWPASYVAVGEHIGLLAGVDTDGHATLTRAEAARLFVNLLRVEKKDGGKLYALGAETELSAIDGGSGKLKTTDGASYDMVHPAASTSLVGTRGRVVLAGDKALTFLPEGTAAASSSTNAAVIVYADRSTAGFDALAGSGDYRIYKNGSPATAADIRKNDVAIYNAATNSILLSDTRVSVRYEACTPTPSAPTKITVLGGTELYVLPTATESLAKFKPGEDMIVFLAADGRVAAAAAVGTAASNSATAIVSADGSVDLLVGGGALRLAAKAAESCFGEAVRVYTDAQGKPAFTVLVSDARGELNVTKRTLGTKKLAENVLLFQNGRTVGFSELDAAVVRAEDIGYARTNWAGEVDLIVLKTVTEEIYGRVYSEEKMVSVYDGFTYVGERVVTHTGILYGNGAGEKTEALRGSYGVTDGDYVVARINMGGTGFALMEKLTEFKAVPASAWIGKSAVTLGGRTYEVATNVLAYNADSKTWVSLDQALAYSDTLNVFARDGVVRVVEVNHRK